MEVTPDNFISLFPRVMDAYSRCSFISIDCEMSGTRLEDTSKPSHKAESPSGGVSSSANRERQSPSVTGKALSLKLRTEAYAKLRATAQKYTVLQVGMTFGWIDIDYTGDPIIKTETYSFLVHPYIDNKIPHGAKMSKAVPRDLTLGSGSIQFLEGVDFDWVQVFTRGLPYLNHAEEKKCREHLNGLHSREHKSDQVEELLAEKGGEAERIQGRITTWLEERPRHGSRMNVFPAEGGMVTRIWSSMVFALVRQKFPQCRAWKDKLGHCIFVRLLDPVTEAKWKADQKKKMDAAIRKAIGLRSFFDMLIGNNIASQIDAAEMAKAQLSDEQSRTGNPITDAALAERTAQLDAQLDDLWVRLESPILVGHNLGWDLAFLIEAFMEPLPEHLWQYVRAVDALFPRLLDTRIVADAYRDEFRGSDLGAISAALDREAGDRPRCEWDVGFGYEPGSGKAHDGGYDSFMTTTAFLKMGLGLVEKKHKEQGLSVPDQASVNTSIVDWRDPAWEPFRGKFKVAGHMARG